jgi:hypothetical protein
MGNQAFFADVFDLAASRYARASRTALWSFAVTMRKRRAGLQPSRFSVSVSTGVEGQRVHWRYVGAPKAVARPPPTRWGRAAQSPRSRGPLVMAQTFPPATREVDLLREAVERDGTHALLNFSGVCSQLGDWSRCKKAAASFPGGQGQRAGLWRRFISSSASAKCQFQRVRGAAAFRFSWRRSFR